MEEQKKGKKKVLFLLLFAVSLVILIGCGILLLIHLNPFGESFNEYKTPTAEPEKEEAEVLPDNPIDFEEIRQTNEDVIAWITLPGTTIDHPILQSADTEEENFYLTHDLNKKYAFDGSVYIQKMNAKDFSDPVTVIYGHDLANGKMFTPLRKFRKADFFQAQDTIYIYLPQHILTYRLYSAFVYDDRLILGAFDFSLENEFQQFIDETLSPKSMVRNVRQGVEVTTDDRLIILSTCTNKESERYLVGGVLIDDQRTK
ncbi:MAG: class B sortase [Clostridia bacterium]|nr:class B sortase [Clostridia bacterium]